MRTADVMNTENKDENSTDPLDQLTTYQPPTLLWEEQFEVRETLRCSCCKTPVEGGQCLVIPGA